MKKQEYAVVRANSTSGAWIMEKSSPDRRRGSIADIAGWGSLRKCKKLLEELIKQ